MRQATAEQLALATEAQAPLPAVQDQEPTSLMEVIARASRDPSVDVDKLERLLQMGERVQAREAKTAYYAAMAEMQPELPVIEERGEIKISENKPGQKYALWEDVNKAIRPVLYKHGFAISFRTGIADKAITVTGVLSHRAGHSEETTIHLPSDTSGSKNAVQAVGSSTSYGKRYVTSALLNLTTGDVDDDGRTAAGNGTISEEQIGAIMTIINRAKFDPAKFCKFMGVAMVADIKAKDYEKAITALNTTERKGVQK